MQLHEFLNLFIAPIEELGVPYFVTGSIASIVYGEPRLTHDVDVVIHLSPEDVDRFLVQFPEEEFYRPPEEVVHIEIRRDSFAHFNLIHHASGLKADIYPDSRDELHAWAFAHRKKVEFGGQSAWLAPPEYVILRKLEYFREGGSEKHIADIQKMLSQLAGGIDSDFLTRMVVKRGLSEQWRQVTG